jgi:hypothetical protein
MNTTDKSRSSNAAERMRLYGKPLRLAGKPTQARGRMRFAFWGAEEHGLVGSAIMSTLC